MPRPPSIVGCSGLSRRAGVGLAWRRVGDQDVPQRDRQGHGGHRHRELPVSAPLRRRAAGAGVAGRDLSGPRLGKGGTTSSSGSRARQAPRRGNARGRGDGSRGGPRAGDGGAIAERHAFVADLAEGGAFAAVGIAMRRTGANSPMPSSARPPTRARMHPSTRARPRPSMRPGLRPSTRPGPRPPRAGRVSAAPTAAREGRRPAMALSDPGVADTAAVRCRHFALHNQGLFGFPSRHWTPP